MTRLFRRSRWHHKVQGAEKESLRKLEHTEQNLLRVQDLIREVKRQIDAAAAGRQGAPPQADHAGTTASDTQLARHQFDLPAEIAEKQGLADTLRPSIEGTESVRRDEDQIPQTRGWLEQEIIQAQQ
jgi:chromosome segregation protein